MTRDELLQRMTMPEYRLWLAEYELEPWGEHRDDLRAGIIASTIANVNSTKRTFKPSDFMIDWSRNVRQEVQEMTDKEMERMAMKCTVMMGGTITKG
jgi:hypothetical protein